MVMERGRDPGQPFPAQQALNASSYRTVFVTVLSNDPIALNSPLFYQARPGPLPEGRQVVNSRTKALGEKPTPEAALGPHPCSS